MSIAEETQRRLNALRVCVQEFSQMINLIDGNFESRMAEIKNLEMRRDRLKDSCDEATAKSNELMSAASDQAAKIQKEAMTLLDQAKSAKLQADMDQKRATQLTAEAQAQMQQAIQRQKEADVQYRILEEKKKRIEEAVR